MDPVISDANDVQPRGKVVTLEGLRTANGPVSVWVEPMDALDSARLFQTWGGSAPQVGLQDESSVDVGFRVESISRPLIEHCVKVKRDGALVQAFSWSGDSVLPTSNLTANDIAALTEAVTELMSGAEGDASLGFPVGAGGDEVGSLVGTGLGDLEAGIEHGPDAVAGA